MATSASARVSWRGAGVTGGWYGATRSRTGRSGVAGQSADAAAMSCSRVAASIPCGNSFAQNASNAASRARSAAETRARCSGVSGRNSHTASRRAARLARRPASSNVAPYAAHCSENVRSTSPAVVARGSIVSAAISPVKNSLTPLDDPTNPGTPRATTARPPGRGTAIRSAPSNHTRIMPLFSDATAKCHVPSAAFAGSIGPSHST